MQYQYGRNTVYQSNIGILKEYADNCYKLIHMKSVRRAGFENAEEKHTPKGEAGNTQKLENNLARAKSQAYELAVCNPWEMFVTLTIDGSKLTRTDLGEIKRAIPKWINNMNQKQNLDIRYLLIPEPHKKDNAWHLHGFMMGIPQEQLAPFTLTEDIPLYIKKLIAQERKPCDWIPYREKFGWVVAEPIINQDHCAKYAMKYITKELMASRIELNGHVFLASHGLERAKEIVRDTIRRSFEPDYQNEYVRVKYFSSLESALSYFADDESPSTMENAALWK